MARIDRWFNFSHNKLIGPKQVVETDFESAYKALMESRPERAAAPSAAPTQAPRRSADGPR